MIREYLVGSLTMFTHVLFLARIARSQLLVKHVKDTRVIPHFIPLSKTTLWLVTGMALALVKTRQRYGNPIRTFSAIPTLHRGFTS